MKTAFIFPGQASQYVGMAQDLYDAYPEVREIYETADAMLDFDLMDVSFNGPLETLTRTDITQPAVFVHSYAVFKLVSNRGLRANVVAGHSLGEFTALVAAGVLNFEDALKIVAERGSLMNKCNETNPGTMAAVLKFDIEKIREACDSIDEVVQVANFNSDTQTVISGSVSGVHRAMSKIKEMGARIVKELEVGGAFHSPLMQAAEDGLRGIIEATTYHPAVCDVYTNVDAAAQRNPEALQHLSVQQLTRSVLWFDILQNMIKDGVTRFVELGPGNVLSGILKRMPGEFEIENVDTLEDLKRLEQA